MIGDKLFSEQQLKTWQEANWRISMPIVKSRKSRESDVVGQRVARIKALTYLLGALPAQQWVAPEQLKPALVIFTDLSIDAELICKRGYEWGYLARNVVDGRSVYRLADEVQAITDAPAPSTYFTPLKEGVAVEVQTDHVPYAALSGLNQIATLTLDKQRLIATPHIGRMGQQLERIENDAALQWLGKQIVHTNLLFARVTDLTLRVKLTHTLKSNEIVELNDEYIAFPPKLLPKIERLVQREGHVVKEGQAA